MGKNKNKNKAKAKADSAITTEPLAQTQEDTINEDPRIVELPADYEEPQAKPENVELGDKEKKKKTKSLELGEKNPQVPIGNPKRENAEKDEVEKKSEAKSDTKTGLDLDFLTYYNGCFFCEGLPNVVLPTVSVRLIVFSSTAILPNACLSDVCLPNQHLTKSAFIANLT